MDRQTFAIIEVLYKSIKGMTNSDSNTGFASVVLLVSMCMCSQVSVHMNSLKEIN